MDDWLVWVIAAVIFVPLVFLRRAMNRGARSAGYELGKKLRGGREPRPAPPWAIVLIMVFCAAMAVVGALFALGTLGGAGVDGSDRVRWGLIAAMSVVGVAGGASELRKRRG